MTAAAPHITARLVVWLVLALLFQPWIGAYRAAAAVGGIEVCTVAGPKRVDADGNPRTVNHGAHDCCCVSAVASPPPSLATHAVALAHESPAATLKAGRIAAEWLSPLSRGPPLLV